MAEPLKKKKKSVKFSNVDEKPKEEKPKKKKHVPELIKEVENAPVTNDLSKKKKKLRNRKKSIKSKLADVGDVITPVVEKVEFIPEHKKFSDFAIDERLLKIIGEMGWAHPTQVQESVIPLALEDKNIMARARTGSGKTAAFLIPTIAKIIKIVAGNANASGPFAIFIGPTKELVTQIFNLIAKFLEPLPYLSCLNLSELATSEKDVWEQECPSFICSTPGKMVEMLKIRSTFCQNVKTLILDEADLLLSYGYENEMITLKEHLPEQYQCIFTSATLTDDMTTLKKLFMTGPVVTIKLKEGDLPDTDQLAQYLVSCLDDEQRFTILVAMLKLKLIVGKTIIFVNSTDRCYKMMLILKAFAIRSCILNSEMPANSRCHVINQFNQGYYNVVIASDAQDAFSVQEADASQKKTGRDKEAGVGRGIDFHRVSNVVNFDFPLSCDIYIHRVGRTARGWNKGTALSFCGPEERPLLDSVQEEINTIMNKTVLKPYEIRMKEIDSFLLRTREALFKCNRGAIKHARIKEIKLELMRSEKLQSFFVNNPRERNLITVTEKPATLPVNEALLHVPDYIVPKSLRGMDYNPDKRPRLNARFRRERKTTFNQKMHKRQEMDPLRTFNPSGKA
ncbi:unnamed protein product [Auanema sp. JU1783]|nr:unnamed protein product [Auanema sp. JU1783]